MTRRWAAARDDTGSAVVDFALVGALLTLLFAAVLQLGVVLYVHNVLVSCASEGARYAARADVSPDAGAARARALISDSLSASYARSVSARYERVDGVQTVLVQVRAPLPLLGFLGPDRVVDVSGHAFAERQ